MEENKNIIERFTVLLTGAWLGDKLKAIFPALIFLTILMLTDYISGMLASKKEALDYPDNSTYGWSSKKSVIGIYKKIGYMLTIVVAISMDYLIGELISKIGISYNGSTFFGLMVILWFIVNELISILENAGRMGAVLPKFLNNVLTELKRNMDKNNIKK